MSNLFKMIDPKFFNILAASNKELYLDCLLEMYRCIDELEQTTENTKEKIVDCVEYILDDRENVIIIEEDAVDLNDNRNKARYIVNHLRDFGWIYEEDLTSNIILINFYPNAVQVIKLILEISSGTQLEYKGFIASINFLAGEIAASKDISHVEQVFKQTDELMTRLKSLKSTIFTYYNNIMKNAKFSSAQQILDELLGRYKQNFFDKAYWNLKTYDNLDKYKDSIQQSIRSAVLDSNIIDDLIISRINEFYKTPETAEQYIRDTLDFVYKCFDDFDYLIKTIDNKNQKYINAAISKVMFFLNRSDDFEGMFNRYISLINQDSWEYGEDYSFNLFECKNLDNSSLHTVREYNRTKAELELISSNELDISLQNEKVNELIKNTEFSYDEIIRYASGLLKDKVKIRASEMPNANSRDFVKIVLIFLYSKSPARKYDVVSLKREIMLNGVSFTDFYIVRRR